MDRKSPYDSRYSRQVILEEVGEAGQEKISRARVVVVGAGATGSMSSILLVRAGIRFLRVIDRDIVELSNLQRQALYTEADAAEGIPKALAAAEHLSAMNREVDVEGVNDHLSPRNIEALLGDVDVVVDGTDNMETRYLINDYCVKEGVPWVYGGALGTTGMAMPIDPGRGPCLRCLFPESPAPARLGSCETVGVLNTVPAIVASYQVSAALRSIVSGGKRSRATLMTFDPWHDVHSSIRVERDPDCPACGRREFPYLREEIKTSVVTMCGEGTFQVYPPSPRTIDLEGHAEVLEGKGEVTRRSHYITFTQGRRSMNIFADGRAQLKGMDSPADALSFYTRYVGM